MRAACRGWRWNAGDARHGLLVAEKFRALYKRPTVFGVRVAQQIHEVCRPLAPLLGIWRGSGSGHYSTINDFAYVEEVVFDHVGKPFFAYSQKTKNPIDGQPLHAERGYLRVINDREVEMVIAQPTGIVEILAGYYAANSDACVINFESTEVATTATAKTVAEVTRVIRLENNEMLYDVSMAAMGQSMQHHLSATLQRVSK